MVRPVTSLGLVTPAIFVPLVFVTPGAVAQYQLRSPWAEDAQKPPLAAAPGKPVRITLQPFQVLVLEAAPEVI